MADAESVDERREAYRSAFEAALYGDPERAARVAELERAVGSAETAEEARAAAEEMSRLLSVVTEEVHDDLRAAGKPVPRRGGRPRSGGFRPIRGA